MGARLLRLVFEREAQIRMRRRQAGYAFAEPRHLAFVIGAEYVIVSVLPWPKIHCRVVEFTGDVTHPRSVVNRLSAHLGIVTAVAALPEEFVSEQVRNDRD